MFEDIPLDTRHHVFKVKPKFPREWRMTEERKKELQALRAQRFQLDEAKKSAGTLTSGTEAIKAALEGPASAGEIPQLVRVAGIAQRDPRGPSSRNSRSLAR
jgi:small subunit ribosomal protein S35